MSTMIPGLDFCPSVDNESESATIDLVSFTGTFRIPQFQIQGICRRIEEFKTIDLLKRTSAWVYRKCQDPHRQEAVCVKRAQNSEVSGNSIDKSLTSVLREIGIVSNLKHDNVMQFYEPAVRDLIYNTYLIFECCEYFLSDILEKEKGFFEKAVNKNIFHQLIQALDYIHASLIIHRDVCPDNLIFRKDGFLKLANFENAREFCSKDLNFETTCKNYCAPEVLLGSKKCGHEVDIWAAACVLAEMFLLEKLFPGNEESLVLQRMVNLLGVPNDTVWPDYSSLPELKKITLLSSHSYNCLQLFFNKTSPQTKETINLLNDIFIYNPVHRITTKEILRHTYFFESPEACTESELSATLETYKLQLCSSKDLKASSTKRISKILKETLELPRKQ